MPKQKNCDDDANFDENSLYKTNLQEYIKRNNIKYLLDFHGLSKKRGIDVNFGTHLGQNIKTNEKLFNDLSQKIKKLHLVTTTDNPFWGGAQTVSGYISKNTGIWTIQIEINFQYTNESKYKDQLQLLIEIFTEFINKIK